MGLSFPLSAQTPEPAGLSAGEETPESPAAPGASSVESEMLLDAPPSAAESVPGASPGEIPPDPGASSIGALVKMVLVLALAALAIYGVVFFIKRLARPRERLDPHLKVLARVSLGGDTFAAVVSVGAKAWLVGGGSGGVSLISVIDDPEPLETMLLDDARRAAGTGAGKFPDFRALLPRFGKAPPAENTESPGGSHAENLRKQRERLRGL